MTPPETGPPATSNGLRPKRTAATNAVAKVRHALFDPPNGGSTRGSNPAGKAKASLACHEAPAASTAATSATPAAVTAALAAAASTAAVDSGEVSSACPEAKPMSVPLRPKKAATEREGCARPAGTSGASNTKNALAKQRGKQGKPSASDGRLKSGGRGRGRGGNGRADARVKPKPGTNAAAIAGILERLAAFGVKVRVSPNPNMTDVWAAVHAVQINLPQTYKLTVDDIVGMARVRHVRTEFEQPSATGFGCGRRFPRPSGASITAAVRHSLSDFVFVATSVFCAPQQI